MPTLRLTEPSQKIIEKLNKCTGIVLGSSSASRRKLLARYTPRFEIKPAHIDEKAIRRSNAEDLVSSLASAKADALISSGSVERDSHTLLITSDQVVESRGEILEKPEDAAEVRRRLQNYASCPARTVGCITVTDLGTGRRSEQMDVAKVKVGEVPDEDVEELIEEGEIFFCAGALMVEDERIMSRVERLDGALDSVMGFGVSAFELAVGQLM